MADTLVNARVSTSLANATGVWGPYWINTTTAIVVFPDHESDVAFSRTTDGGATWTKTEIVAGNLRAMTVWFDQETPGDTGTTVHIGWLDVTANIAYYVNVDISDGSQGTIRTVDSGITVNNSVILNRIAITKTVSGNLIYAFSTQTEIECYKSDDLFATAGTDIADVYETTTEEDWCLLYPADVDAGDAAGIFWDRSANAISLKMYDDSANTWTETSIGGSMTGNANIINMDGAVRHSDGHILMAAHSATDSATADLMTWDLTPDSIAAPTVTAKTNVFTDQGESGQTGVVINQQNDDVYISYLHGTNWRTSVDAVYKKSTDGMGTWGSEEAYSENTADDLIAVHGGRTVGDSGGFVQFQFFNIDLGDIFVNLVNDIAIPAASAGGDVKTWNGIAIANVKTINGIAIANVKTINGIDN